ncbi:ATP-dependent Clp protease proteolytic subunit [Bradyrhizobium diazoefficiens]|uniref:ATP-dependent Clp protease proteolytic subunit n=1 Tax=Bradyrhizobium diazoefficiens TaxID=1355477 RepID=UPI00347DAFFC
MTENVPEAMPPKKVHMVFAGNIDQIAVQRLANAIAIASQQGMDEVHLLFQTTGGVVADGVCLYNLFAAAPMDIHLYNVGSIASIGVVAYLGADFRYTTNNATFMIHKVTFSPQAATVDRLQSLANAAALDDRRIEDILHQHIELPKEKWDIHKVSDLWLSAEEALAVKLADRIGEFSPSSGEQLYYVGQ